MDWASIIERTFSGATSLDDAVFALAAIGLNVHFGYTGLLNFGQVGFMAAGAYGVGMTVWWLDWNFWWGIPMGVLYAIVLALLLGLPSLRLRADYLAITTIAASESIRLFVRWRGNDGRTGASEGINDFADPFYSWNPFEPDEFYGLWPIKHLGSSLWAILIGWALVGVMVFLTWQLMRSPWGRALKAIREDEDAARALGKNAYSFKVQALMLGGVIGGFAGMIQVIGKQSVQPDTFNPVITFMIWTALIVGGVGRIWSPVIGAMIFWGLLNFVNSVMVELLGTSLEDDLDTFFNLSDFNVFQVRFMIVGLVLVLLMRYRPQGIFGSREEMALDDR